MEAHRRSYLDREEVVDHIDGNRSNNAPDNLRVFPNSKAHLEATLKGRMPNWSEDGEKRIYEGLEKGRQRLAEQLTAK